MMHVRWSIASSLVALLLIANVACGEIPKLSREELLSDASAAFTGKVVETYERVRKSETYEETSGVAEIAVERIEKGSDIAVGDRAFVRYWHKRWIGQGPSPPDHYGHWNIPSQGDVVSIFVRGDRKKGFDVLSPNGFFEVKKAAKEKSGKPK
jgi:hypothetical protein